MEVCRLCLDLIHEKSFPLLNDSMKVTITVVVPEVDLQISSNPVICEQCRNSIEDVYNFKTKFIENEQRIKQKCNGDADDQQSLKEILYGVSLGEIILTEQTKERICRICLDSIECESFTILKPSKPDAYLNSMITMCLPELDLELSRDPVMCEKCLSHLQKLHQLRTACLDSEEKIKNFCTNHGTNSSSQINLHSVLETLVRNERDQLNFVPIKSEVKTEIVSDGDVEMNDKSKVIQPELERVKEEEMEVKLEDYKR